MGKITDQEKLDRFYHTVSRKIEGWDQSVGKVKNRYPLLRVLPIHEIVQLVLVVPAVLHLLISIVNDENISRKTRYKIYFAIGYFLFPLDLIPEAIVGPIGYVDDVVIALRLIDTILNGDNEHEQLVINQAWQRSPQELEQLRQIVRQFDLIHHLGKRVNRIFK